MIFHRNINEWLSNDDNNFVFEEFSPQKNRTIVFYSVCNIWSENKTIIATPQESILCR